MVQASGLLAPCTRCPTVPAPCAGLVLTSRRDACTTTGAVDCLVVAAEEQGDWNVKPGKPERLALDAQELTCWRRSPGRIFSASVWPIPSPSREIYLKFGTFSGRLVEHGPLLPHWTTTRR